ncbi:hypothetical protein GGR56DRAFT_647312 [Xylariaceae sp. FL0804]|nr:hypothetical protein GGR56DRAFT_647312 [Xylariaceae sp. FL0804]
MNSGRTRAGWIYESYKSWLNFLLSQLSRVSALPIAQLTLRGMKFNSAMPISTSCNCYLFPVRCRQVWNVVWAKTGRDQLEERSR